MMKRCRLFASLLLASSLLVSCVNGQVGSEGAEASVETSAEATVASEGESATPDSSVWSYPMREEDLERPMNILAFGGSVTWGATLADRMDAFPFLMGSPNVDHVDNMAMRATGADYPSLCLESIIPDAENKNYDVIMFDFVLNGTDGFPLLLKRLRERYPSALIIYVHIWSIVNLARDAITGTQPHPKAKEFNPDREWVWKGGDTFNPGSIDDCGREVCGKEQMEQLVKDAGGYIWTMPRPDTVKEVLDAKWFSSDWHHLSKEGHTMIANELLALLQEHRDKVFEAKPLGTFGIGDQCWNWFQNGDIGIDYFNAEPFNMLGEGAQNPTGLKKMTLAMDSAEGGFMGFDSRFDVPVPVGLAYMSMREPRDYPKVEVCVNSLEHQPPVVIDPAYNNNLPNVHIVVYAHVGWALPGRNSIVIKPLEERNNPFRVVGIYLCGECAKMGDLGNGAVNSPEYSGPLEVKFKASQEKRNKTSN